MKGNIMVKDFFVERARAKPFDEIEENWMKILYDQLREVMHHNVPFTRIAFISLYGSQNYHLAGPYSDIDSECFVFPSMDDLCFAKTPTSFKLHTEYGDVYVKDIRLMFDELRKVSPNILELLASDYMWINKEYSYYINSILMNVDMFAKLSTYKLLKGLEGLMRRYGNPIDLSPKYLVNAMRIQQMIERIAQGEDFSSTLVPENVTGLFNMKYRNPLPEDGDILETVVLKARADLDYYFEKHDFVFQPHIKEIINDYQKGLLMKYIHTV